MTRSPCPLRTILASTLIASGCLLILAANVTNQHLAAANPTCPPGYTYEPWMGIDCIQTKVPPHGKISYTGEAICEDGYVAVYAPGPNEYGSDPETNYLVECITPEEAARRAAASAHPESSVPPNAEISPAQTGPPGSQTGVSAGSGGDPVAAAAGAVVEDGSQAPDKRDTGLAGVTATGLLIVGCGAGFGLLGPSELLGGGSGGGPGGGAGGTDSGGGTGGGGASQTPSPTGSPDADELRRRRDQLDKIEASLARTVKRVTDATNPDTWGPQEIAELTSDAAAIAAIAGPLAVPAGGVALAAGAVSQVGKYYSPRETIESMRGNLSTLGYLQGQVQADLSNVDAQLRDIATGKGPAPEPTLDFTSMSDADLQAARQAAAARTDAAFDDAIAAQKSIGETDDRRRNLMRNIDVVKDQLAQLQAIDGQPSVPFTALGLASGTPAVGGEAAVEHFATDVSLQRMNAAFQAQAMDAAAAAASKGAAAASTTLTQTSKVVAGFGAGAAATSGVLGAVQVHNDRAIDSGLDTVHRTLADMERMQGFNDARANNLQDQIAAARTRADQAIATRRAISAEIDSRAMAAAGFR